MNYRAYFLNFSPFSSFKSENAQTMPFLEFFPGQSCSTVNGRNVVNYGGKRQTCTIIVYGHRIRCFTIYYDDRKLLP